MHPKQRAVARVPIEMLRANNQLLIDQFHALNAEYVRRGKSMGVVFTDDLLEQLAGAWAMKDDARLARLFKVVD